MLDQILYMIGMGVLFYFAIGAILVIPLRLLNVAAGPLERLDRWLKSKAPQRTYTKADHLQGWAVASAAFVLVALVLHLTVWLR